MSYNEEKDIQNLIDWIPAFAGMTRMFESSQPYYVFNFAYFCVICGQ